MKRPILFAVFLLLGATTMLFSGTTGKIAGIVKDARTGEALPGVNILVDGTVLGAATDADGYYVILNVPPGTYTVRATFIGYTDYIVTQARVNIDQTTTLNFDMAQAVVESGSEITVVADRPVVQRDVSASTANIEAAQIEALPVQTVTEVVGLQAGVQGLSIRGGGSDELAFMVDGFTMRDERDNTPFTGVSLSAVQDVQIQTGGFNAEYGNIRSGVINVVTKEGDPQRYSGTLTYQYSAPTDKHFGPSFDDPNSYWLRPYLDPAVAWTGTQNGAWDADMQRQYPQFDGWNAIAAQTLLDNDPNNDLTPAAAQRLFLWQHRRQLDITKSDYNIDAGVGGPVPGGAALGNLRFYASYRGEREMYLIPLVRDSYEERNLLVKLTSDLSNNMKLTISGLYNSVDAVGNNDVGQPGVFRSAGSVADVLTQAGFTINSRIFYDSYWPLSDVDRYNISAKFTHALSSNTFYEAKLERVHTKYHTRPNAQRDTTKVYDVGVGFLVDEAPYGNEERLVFGVDGMLMGVRANARDFSELSTTTLKFDFTSQVNNTNLIKTGIEVVHNNYNMEFGAINDVLPTQRPWTDWERSPLRAALYLQDKLEFKGLIANAGLRLDYIDPRGTWWNFGDDPYNQAFFSTDFDPGEEVNFDQVSVDKQLTISPRLGISHPITINSKLFFNYGHFRQMPISDRLYNVRRTFQDQLSLIGDPNLPLQKTVAYELGYEHSLLDAYLLRVTGYYKDISNQYDLTDYYSANGKVRYSKATSNSYEDIRGFEATIEKRAGRWFSGFANYTYQVSTSGFFGIGSYFENPAEQRNFLRDSPPTQSKPVARPFFRSNLVFRSPRDFGPDMGGINPLADWIASFLVSWQSGLHFTWTNTVSIPGLSNNVQWKDYYNVNLRLSRNVNFKPLRLTLFADIANLFNIKYWGYGDGFVDGEDYNEYMRSLRLPKDIADEFAYVPVNGYGDDRPGDSRPDDVAYEPLELNPEGNAEIERRNQKRIDDKAYIDNPNQTYLQFLNPRDIFIGLKVSFDF